MTTGQLIDAVLSESRKAQIQLDSVQFGDTNRPFAFVWSLGKHHFMYSLTDREELESKENPKFVEYIVSRARWSLAQFCKDEHDRKAAPATA